MHESTHRSSYLLALPLLLIAAVFHPGVEAALYKWVDDQGQVHFGDKIPTEFAKQKQEEVDKQGFTIRTIQERMLTPEERVEAARLQEEAAEKKRLEDEKKLYNARLLRTYESVEDLEQARDDKLGAVDSLIRLAEGQIHERETLLARQHKRAADLERSGKPMEPKLQKAIDTTQKQIAANRQRIESLQQEKEALRTSYDADIALYKRLKGIR